MLNWTGYLESLCNDYAKWQDAYTLTDVVGRNQIEQTASRLLFDFDLMVQTVQSAKEERSETQEKIEHLGVLEGLRKYAKEHVLLVGRPGSGKSTALARLLLEEAQKYSPSLVEKKIGELGQIPVLVELRYYQTSVLDLIRDFFKRHKLLLEKQDIEKLLFDGQLLLLVDGVNELPTEEARRDLQKFRQDYQKTTPMIFTTRDLGVGGDLNIAKKLEMQPLTEEQMQQFVRAYLPEQGEQMLNQLGNRLREFGETPLLLMMLCSLFKGTGNIPPNLGMVFRKFSTFFDNQRLQGVLVPDEFKRWRQKLLQSLALSMTQGREATELQVAISKLEAEEKLKQFLQNEGYDKHYKAGEWLEYLIKHHLIELRANDQIEFHHQLIQEYYTAEDLLKQLPNFSDDCLKQDYLNYLKWTEPLVLTLELVDERAQAVRVVKLALEVDWQLGARLAGAVKSELQLQTVDLVAELEVHQLLKIKLLGLTKSDKAIPHLNRFLQDEDSDVRRSAALALGKIKSEQAIPGLIQLLQDKNSYVRRSAALALGKIKSEQAIPGLIQLLQDEDFYVRRSAALALGEIKSEQAIPGLIQLLQHEDSDVRRIAALALGEIKLEQAIPGLIQLLQHEYSDVRYRAAFALGEIKSEQAIPGLIQLLQHEDFYVRRSAASALGEIKSEQAIPGLIQLLQHEYSDVRYRAAFALREIKSEQAIPGLIQLLQHEYSDVRYRAAFALGKIKSEQAIPGLIQLLQDEDSDVRSSAAYALGEIKSEQAIPGLIQLLQDKNSYVRRSAASALGEIKSEEAIPGLIQLLQDEDYHVRRSAADALGEIKSEQAIPGLIQLFQDKNSYVRGSAASALGKIKSEQAIPELIQLLHDEVSDVRSSAAYALGEIKSEQAIPGLIQLFQDKNSYVRGSAALALGKIKSEQAIPGLIQLLQHEYSDVRSSAASALGKIKSEQAIPGLIQLIQHKNSYMRSSAASALGKIKSEQAIPELIQLLQHEYSDVRSSAASALGKIKSEQAIPELIQLLHDEVSDVRSSAASALGEIKSEQAIPELIQLLHDEVSDVRSSAASALGEIKSEQAISGLIQILQDEDSFARRSAADALRKIKSEQAISGIIQLLQNEVLVAANNGETLDRAINILAEIQEYYKYYNYTLIHPITAPKIQPDISSSPSIKSSLMYILHLSDLHFGTPEQANLWSNQLAEDLQNELNIPHLNTLILSGDIANYSTPEEYQAAQQFIDNLRQDFSLQPEQIIIVPGNHDLNWQLAKKAYKLIDRDDYQGELKQGEYIEESASVIRMRDEEKYKQRFENFSNFYQTIKGKPYPLEYDQQYTLDHFPDQNLLILGLNSAWQLDHHYKSRAGINMDAFSNALTEIRRNQQYKSCIKIAVWHHPLDSAWDDRIKDQGFIEQLAVAGFRLFLHGHIHKAETSQYRYDLSSNGRRCDRICAGTFGAPVREWVPGYPLQYNLLKLENNKLTVNTRRREEVNGAWKPDARWLQGAGQNPLPYYEIQLLAE